MKSRAVNTTKEQDEFRAAILKGKHVGNVKKEPKKYVPAAGPFSLLSQDEKNGVFISNCAFWINEYLAGRCELQRVKSAARHLVEYHFKNFKLNYMANYECEADYNAAMQGQVESEAQAQADYYQFLDGLSKSNPWLHSLYVTIDFLAGKKDCADAIKYLTDERNRIENPAVKPAPLTDGFTELPF